jgi:hypothetical protein
MLTFVKACIYIGNMVSTFMKIILFFINIHFHIYASRRKTSAVTLITEKLIFNLFEH